VVGRPQHWRGIEEPGLFDRFDQAGCDSGVFQHLRLKSVPHRGEHHQTRLGRILVVPDVSSQSQAVHLRHLHVEQCQVVRLTGCGLGLQAIRLRRRWRQSALHFPGRELVPPFSIRGVVIHN
jgi:hypothetical protein